MKEIDVEEIVRKVLDELTHKENGAPGSQEANQQAGIIFSDDKEVGVTNPHNIKAIERAQQITPARIGIGRTGTRMRTKNYLQFRIDHAAAQDAVFKDVSEEFLNKLGLPKLVTKAPDMRTYLMDLDSGRMLSEQSVEWLKKNGDHGRKVQILVCDGLSSSAVEANAADLLAALMQGLELKKIQVGKPLFVKRSRVWVQDQIASILNCELIVSLIGERPGLSTDESLSAYMVYRPNALTVEADRTVIANIHKGGISPVEAGAYLADLISEMLALKCTGVKFSQKKNQNQ